MTPSKDPARPLPSSRRRFGPAALACRLPVLSDLRPTARAMVLPLALAAGVPAWDMARAQEAGGASLVPLTAAGDAPAVLRPVARPADLVARPASASATSLARTAAEGPAGSAVAVEAPDPESRSLARSVMGVLSTTTAPGRDGVVAAALAVESALNPAPEGVSPAEAVAAVTPLRPRARPEGLAATPAAWFSKPDAPCLPAAGFPDPDVRRNLASFQADAGLCLSRAGFTEHGRSWQLTVVRNLSARRGPVWAVLHDNENAAFDSALYAVRRYGGALVAVEAGESRTFQGQDPNRNFSLSASTAATCRDISAKPTPGFTKAITSFFSDRYPVLTLHNNDEGYSGAGGRGHISARRSSASMTGMMTPTPQGALSDEDNAILLADTRPFAQSAASRKATAAFHAQGVNVIYEHVRPERNDCSFSFFTRMNGLGDYYNIEAQFGAGEAQRRMVDVLMAYLGIAPLR
ncbi:hypothetical protein [Pseudooceanicola marinus]|uniref:hypothetical protein n=1 Tax=Pseudooceanicola marinus TaxID=396013 RepID=UPI001CD6D8BB|nr:hypothetical protein [Pseudooceanicola marinus]MCA1335059.1 hypothetical protein [Pseudooceanicola marinus]